MAFLPVVVCLSAFLAVQVYTVAAYNCACASTNVNIRSGPGTGFSILGSLSAGTWLKDKGGRTTLGGYTWANVDYDGRDAWVSSNYLDIAPCGGDSASSYFPRFISRAQWGARTPTTSPTTMSATPSYVFIHHGTGSFCSSQTECTNKVQIYQNHHMDTNGWSDIGYSFVVGEDGNAYEGRGWTAAGAHTTGYNDKGIGICVVGDFTSRVPNSVAQTAVKQLIQCGVSSGKITSTYRLLGHKDVGSTSCPGTKFYELIRTWPHYG